MQVNWDGTVYEFDLDDLDMTQAKVIKERLGLTLLGLEKGLNEGDANALLAVYWLMNAQAGTAVPWDSNFKIIKFANAVAEAIEAEQAAKTELEGSAPKD